jgi:hypothetical protein
MNVATTAAFEEMTIEMKVMIGTWNYGVMIQPIDSSCKWILSLILIWQEIER